MNQFGATRDVRDGSGFSSDAGALLAPDQRAVAEKGNVLTFIGTITSQIVLITALFYYFGWVYTHSFYSYFGVDTSLIGYSTEDYVLRSINVAFSPFIYLAFVSLALFGFHRLVMAPALRTTSDLPSLSDTVNDDVSGPAASGSTQVGASRVVDLVVGWTRALGCWRLRLSGIRWIIGVFQGVALILAVAVFAGILLFEQFVASLGLLLPLVIMLSVSLLGYVSHVRWTYSEVLAVTTSSRPISSSRIYTLTLLTLGLIAALWAVSLYGGNVGTRQAINFAAQLPVQPKTVIYSTERIALNGPGIDVREVTQSGTKYRYQYTGLRLLIHSSEKFLLLPSRWQRGRDRVFFLPDDNSIRIDIGAQ